MKKEKTIPLIVQKAIMIVGFPIWFPIAIAIFFAGLIWALLSATVEILLETDSDKGYW